MLASFSKRSKKFWGRLNDKVIKPSVEEINLKINDMDLEVISEKRGRKVTKIEIKNNFYPRKQSTENPVPMTNWLNN